MIRQFEKSVEMEETRLNLVVLIVNALHGLLSFYGKDYTMINVDGLFGLRIIEGQLKRIYSSEYQDVPLEIIKAVQSLSLNASKLANMAIPHVYEDDPVYFKKFKYLVNRPWDIAKPYRLTNEQLIWPADIRKDEGCIDEKESDECVGQLMVAAAVVAENWNEDSQRQLGCNRVTTTCLQRMMKRKGCSGYSVTHQLLYVAVAELVGCLVVVDEYAKTIGFTGGIDHFTTEFCSNLLKDLERLVAGSKSSEDRHRGFHVLQEHQDLFMELQFVCGQLGFIEFGRREWLEAILSWQNPSGCYTNAEPVQDESPVVERIPKRRPMLEKDLADNCASHKSAVAAGALSIYLRFLIEPLPDEFGHHLRLDSQSSRHPSIPLADTFWKAPHQWTYDAEQLAPVPRRGLPTDGTVFWFLAIAVCFLYVSYRLCRRQNLRYARWRGLKWR